MLPALSGRERVAPRLLAVLAAALLAATSALVLAAAPPAGAAVTTGWQQDMLTQVNSFRASNGLGPLQLCNNLTAAAQVHADDMATSGVFSHTGTDGSTFVQRIEAAGYLGWQTAGENLAAGYSSVTAVMGGWIASAGHRANLLGPYADAGFAIAFAADGTPYWDQEFGSGGVCGSSIEGSVDEASGPAPGVLHVRGWALDTTDETRSLQVRVDVDGATVATTTASVSRLDISNAFSGAGSAHGYDLQVVVPGGNHQVCVIGTNPANGRSGLVGCQVAAIPSADPFGAEDPPPAAAPGTAVVNGWAMDPDATSANLVAVYVDGVGRAMLTANQYRADLALLYPRYGGNHGYSTTITGLTGGQHAVCTYGINQGNGQNTLLGCRYPYVANANPVGYLDAAGQTGPGTVTVSGWSFDPETTGPITVHVYVDGVGTPITANGYRPDVALAYPGIGQYHGYSASVPAAAGTHTVCTYGINVGQGVNTLLGCRVVTVGNQPVGWLDRVSRTTTGQVRVQGWTIDLDNTQPITSHVYADGVPVAVVAANVPRADLAAVYPTYGGNHGLDTTVSLSPGTHLVCAYGINTLGGTSNVLLGCSAVSV